MIPDTDIEGLSRHVSHKLVYTCKDCNCEVGISPTAEAVRDWDIDRLVFYIGELESQVARLSKPVTESDVTITLTYDEAQRMLDNLLDAIEYHEGADTERGEELASNMAEIYDAIVAEFPKEDQ